MSCEELLRVNVLQLFFLDMAIVRCNKQSPGPGSDYLAGRWKGQMGDMTSEDRRHCTALYALWDPLFVMPHVRTAATCLLNECQGSNVKMNAAALSCGFSVLDCKPIGGDVFNQGKIASLGELEVVKARA